MSTIKRMAPFVIVFLCLVTLSSASAQIDAPLSGHYVQQDGVVYFVSADRADAISIIPDAEIVIFRSEIEGKPVFMDYGTIKTSKHAKVLRLEKGLQGSLSLKLDKWDSLEQLHVYLTPGLFYSSDYRDMIEALGCPKLKDIQVTCDEGDEIAQVSLMILSCPSLSEIHIANGPKALYAYSDGGSPETICYVPASANQIFASKNLWLQLDPANRSFYMEDDVLYRLEDKALLHYPERKTDEHFTVRKGTKHVTIRNPYLKQLTLPAFVETVDLACENLAKIDTTFMMDGAYADGMDAQFPTTVETLKLSSDAIESISLPTWLHNLSLDCKNLTDIALSPKNRAYRLVDGVLYSRDMTHLVYYPQALPATQYTTAHEALLTIDIHNPYLKQLYIPQLGEHNSLSLQCDALETISLPASYDNGIYWHTDFDSLPSLHTINIASGGMYSTKDGAIYSADGKELLFVPEGKEGTFIIAEGTEIIFYDMDDFYRYDSLYDSAFSHAHKIEKVVFPSTVETISAKAFEQNKSLVALEVSPDHPQYMSKNGAVFTKDGKTLIAQLISGRTHLALPAGIEAVGTGALPTNNVLESLTIPLGVHTLEEGALSGNLALHQVSLPQTLRWVKDSAFQDCMRLDRVVFPEGVTWIESAFDTSGPMGYELSDGFGYSFSSIEITLPSTLSIIADDAFVTRYTYYGRGRAEVTLIVPSQHGYAKDYAELMNIPHFVKGEPTLYNPVSSSYTMLHGAAPDRPPRTESDVALAEGSMVQLLSQDDGGCYILNDNRWLPISFIADASAGVTLLAKNMSRLCVLPDAAYAYNSPVLPLQDGGNPLPAGMLAQITRSIGPWYEISSYGESQKLYIDANHVQLVTRQGATENEFMILTESLSATTPLHVLPQDHSQIAHEFFAGTIVHVLFDDGTWAYVNNAGYKIPRGFIRSEYLRETSEQTVY